MSKKIISLLLTCCILCCLSACGTTTVDVQITPSESQADNTVQNVDEIKQTESKNEETSCVETSKGKDVTQKQPTENQTKPQITVTQTTAHQTAEHKHNYSGATCTYPQRCSCGATAGNALGHNFSPATCSNPKTCSRCGVTNGSALGHNYVNNKCSRCGKSDPDSLPVGLNNLFLIDSYEYQYKSGSFTDSFGNHYDGVHRYTNLYKAIAEKEPSSQFNLNGKYKLFTGSIVASTTTNPNWTYYINIYVDGVLKFSKTGFSKTSGKVDFKVNVTNGQTLKITAGVEGRWGDVDEEICIVNAKLFK